MANKESSEKKEKSFRRSLIEWSVIVIAALTLYLTGYHTQVIGTVQRAFLATGLITPSLSIDYDEMRDAGTEFYFADKDHRTQSLAEHKGNVVFLNVWASWCPPCIAEMPSIANLYSTFKDREGYSFILVSMDEDFSEAERFMESRDLDLPIYHYRGRDRDIFQSDLLPTTYVITPDGKIAMEKQGMAKYDTPAFKKFLEDLADLQVH
ncbi:TlpA family protein disulfide reductase [Rhodohalobacter sp. SW132]|uniref:TlpA family protein disulfide reductase n=1 Tax=Rhodohalobacter sp. SW132 TaxID=2293433 RepID=UPI000E243689|nr:TlpA disulfide reductase family protein [Rhodohalobacter sp. SW132]REL38745.1 TlpA family protein disulfide reductase [Rhodohalobacter sp. SW132]